MLVSKKYIKKLVESKAAVAIQPMFDDGVRFYAVYVEGFPGLVLGKFPTAAVARKFCSVMKLEIAYDGAF